MFYLDLSILNERSVFPLLFGQPFNSFGDIFFVQRNHISQQDS